MKILSVAGCPYEDNKGEVLNLYVKLDSGEKIAKGDTVRIEMMDDSFLEREIKIINPKFAGDFAEVSEKTKLSGWKRSKTPTISVTGECVCNLVVMNVPYHEVKTDEEINARKMAAERARRFCLTPYNELKMGEESIYDHIDKSISVPDKVILYLQTKELYFFCPGIYNHPFKDNSKLLGPYVYTDGYYYWDRDTWKYVVKYGLVLPQEFIDYVMTDEATKFLDQKYNSDWHLTERKNMLNLLPKDSGDIPLDQF